tara:strand:+ start:328 stop:717 length:390 start_codon:yes stop_codon:yes gene_type:complete
MVQKIESFDKLTLPILRDELEEALGQLSKSHNLKIKVGSMSYQEHEVDVKINILIKGQKSHTENVLESFANAMELDLSRIVNRNGKAYSLVDYRPKSRVWEFVVQDNKTGKQVLMKRETILEMFGRESA